MQLMKSDNRVTFIFIIYTKFLGKIHCGAVIIYFRWKWFIVTTIRGLFSFVTFVNSINVSCVQKYSNSIYREASEICWMIVRIWNVLCLLCC